MSIKEQDVPCALCCGSLSIWMSKEAMQGLLETLIKCNLTSIGFTERNDNMKPVDRAKRIQELSSQAVEAGKLIEQITSKSAQTTRQQLPGVFLKTEPLPGDSMVKIDTTTFDKPCIKIVIRVPELGVAYAENVFIEDRDLAALSWLWRGFDKSEKAAVKSFKDYLHLHCPTVMESVDLERCYDEWLKN